MSDRQRSLSSSERWPCCRGRASRRRRSRRPIIPSVTVRGQTYTPRSILARNMGSEADQTTAFPPHKIIGNIYYVGTRTLSSFLIVTPRGKHPHRQHL